MQGSFPAARGKGRRESREEEHSSQGRGGSSWGLTEWEGCLDFPPGDWGVTGLLQAEREEEAEERAEEGQQPGELSLSGLGRAGRDVQAAGTGLATWSLREAAQALRFRHNMCSV